MAEKGGADRIMGGKYQEAELLFLMKKINIHLEIRLEKILKQQNISGTQVYFLVYILRRHPMGTYITDMYREIGISKATLSGLVKKMRGKGYLCFQENPGDTRRKKVVPTRKLMEESKELLQRAQGMETEFLKLWTLMKRNNCGTCSRKS
jgi:DNA-binding MarR family transcriptional regulator